MLVYINITTKRIHTHNEFISKEDAQEYINDVDCFWIDGLKIEYPQYEENQIVEMYLNDDNTIRYEVVDLPQDELVTDAELIQQRFTDLELQNLEGQLERQMLAQQISDLEIILLGGMR